MDEREQKFAAEYQHCSVVACSSDAAAVEAAAVAVAFSVEAWPALKSVQLTAATWGEGHCSSEVETVQPPFALVCSLTVSLEVVRSSQGCFLEEAVLFSPVVHAGAWAPAGGVETSVHSSLVTCSADTAAAARCSGPGLDSGVTDVEKGSSVVVNVAWRDSLVVPGAGGVREGWRDWTHGEMIDEA